MVYWKVKICKWIEVTRKMQNSTGLLLTHRSTHSDLEAEVKKYSVKCVADPCNISLVASCESNFLNGGSDREREMISLRAVGTAVRKGLKEGLSTLASGSLL